MFKKFFLIFGVFLGAGIVTVVSFERLGQKPYAYVPIDESLTFLQYETDLKLSDVMKTDRFAIRWSIFSQLERKAYIREDFSLLFEDGLLVDTMLDWQEHEDTIQESKKVIHNDSGHFQAVTVHYARIHDRNDAVKNQLRMSYDHLFVTSSPHSSLESFKVPRFPEEKEWQKILQHATRQQLHFVWKQLIDHFHIKANQMTRIPLAYLPVYDRHQFPGLNKEKSKQLLVAIWETLYSKYFRGIETRQKETTTSPVGSTMPLILLSKDGSQFFILTQTKDGENICLEGAINASANES